MSRRKVRERVLDILYRYEIRGEPQILDISSDYVSNLKHNDSEYLKKLLSGIKNNIKDLDNIIKKYSKNWEFDRIFYVDKNILRVAIYEMANIDDVPLKVAINEALELAKKYGTTDSYRFINGILDRIMKEGFKPDGKK